jgi:tetratricopeptide (TPR) repeat protein
MSDDIRRLSEELARDPSSLVFLQLGESLRRTGQLDLALKVSLRGLERHAHNAEAHDLLARICVDRGELERAFDEWDMVLRLAPGHLGARKGMGYVLFKQGRFAEAERHLSDAAGRDDADGTIATALEMVRRRLAGGEDGDGARGVGRRSSGAVEDAQQAEDAGAVGGDSASDARLLFDDILKDGEQAALLLDATGLVMAGTYVTHDGREVGQEVGAELSGVSEEARRAMRHLGLGDWSSLVFETEAAVIAMSPMPEDRLMLVAAAKSLPLGFVQRVLDRCARAAERWLREDR